MNHKNRIIEVRINQRGLAVFGPLFSSKRKYKYNVIKNIFFQQNYRNCWKNSVIDRFFAQAG